MFKSGYPKSGHDTQNTARTKMKELREVTGKEHQRNMVFRQRAKIYSLLELKLYCHTTGMTYKRNHQQLFYVPFNSKVTFKSQYSAG